MTASTLSIVARSAAVATFGALAIAPAVLADGGTPAPGPGTPAAVNAYVETLPTGSGSQAVGQTSGKKTKLPAKTRAKVRKQSPATAKALKEIATSAAYGAPQTTLPSRSGASQSKPSATPQSAASSKSKLKGTAHPRKARAAVGAGGNVTHTKASAKARLAAQPTASSPDSGTNPLLYLALVAVLGVVAVGGALAFRRRGAH